MRIANPYTPFNPHSFTLDSSEAALSSIVKERFCNSSPFFLYENARSGLLHALCVMKELRPNKAFVAVPVYTCAVVINSIFKAGLKPLFLDIDELTLGTSPQSLCSLPEFMIDNILVVVAQHTFGLSCQLASIHSFCTEYDLYLLEDCALVTPHAQVTQPLGVTGDFSIYSFDTSKPINSAYGGLLFVNNHNLLSSFSDTYEALPSIAFGTHLYYVAKATIEQLPYQFHISRIGNLTLDGVLKKILQLIFRPKDNTSDYLIPPFPAICLPYKPHRLFRQVLISALHNSNCFYEEKRQLFASLCKTKYLHPSFYQSKDPYLVPHRILIRKDCGLSPSIVKFFPESHHWYSLLQGAVVSNDFSFPRKEDYPNSVTTNVTTTSLTITHFTAPLIKILT